MTKQTRVAFSKASHSRLIFRNLTGCQLIPIFLYLFIFFQNFPIYLNSPIFPIFSCNLDIFSIFFPNMPLVLIMLNINVFFFFFFFFFCTACRYFYLQFTTVIFFFCHLHLQCCHILRLIHVDTLMMNLPNFKL